MMLSKEDGELYYKLWLPLLDYVNKKYDINQNIKEMVDPKLLVPKDVKEISDKMWGDVSVIDEYLSKKSDDIFEEHKEIIRSWKRRIQGKFVLERHLKKGSIFISLDDEQVYQVNGIKSRWEEMLRFKPIPIIIKAIFMPFKDIIITDGIVISYNVRIGTTMKREFKDTYMAAKKSGMIHKTL